MAISLTQAHATTQLKNEIRALFAADGEMKGQC
jgi:hypothetical protein